EEDPDLAVRNGGGSVGRDRPSRPHLEPSSTDDRGKTDGDGEHGAEQAAPARLNRCDRIDGQVACHQASVGSVPRRGSNELRPRRIATGIRARAVQTYESELKPNRRTRTQTQR